MGFLGFLRVLQLALRPLYSKKTIERIREKEFRKLLHFVWDHSPFYQRHYQNAGIKREDLARIPIHEIPFTDKKLIMDNVDEVFTSRDLNREEIEKWLGINKNPHDLYKGKYVILHTSGTSGTPAMIGYEASVFNVMIASQNLRSNQFKLPKFRPIRIAFVTAIHGHFAGVSAARNAPQSLFDFFLVSVLDSMEEIVNQLNEFQPEHLYGYSSIIRDLADQSLMGNLKISPKVVIVSGELCTDVMAEQIEKAWRVPLGNAYATTESLVTAFCHSRGKGFEVWDDFSYLEMLDTEEKNVKDLVLTNLFNWVTPLIRYQIGDSVETFPEGDERTQSGPFSKFFRLKGRSFDSLPILTNKKTEDSIHSIVLVEFFVPGLKEVQFVSHSIDRVVINYVADTDLTNEIEAEFKSLLVKKQAEKGTTFEMKKVDQLEQDGSGKAQFIKIVH